MKGLESIHDIPTLINQFIASADDSDVSINYSKELAELIESDEMTLLKFIQSLGPSLTSDSDLIRLKSIQCMAETLKCLKVNKLSKQDVNVLVEFLLAKFEDIYCLVHIISSLNSLILFKNFIFGMNNNVEKLLTNILNNYNPKKHLAKVRYEPFRTLNALVTIDPAYFQSSSQLSQLMVKTFIHIASGEKDPRNLLLSFDTNTKINENFEFDPLNEVHKDLISELFDVCFCYFPISFSPPPNDPYKITAQDLKLKLRNTIASQSYFAKESFADLVEKLTSTNPVIRNDILKTLLLCVENYTLETVAEYWVTIWNALKFEVLHNDVSIFKPYIDVIIPEDYDEEIDDSDEFKPLITTLVIIKKLASRMTDFGELENSLTTITNELKSNITTINDKTFKQSVVILSVLASDSSAAFNFIIQFLFSQEIWGKYINAEDDSTTEELSSELDKTEDLVLNTSKQKELIDNLGFVLTSYNVLLNNLESQDEFIENNYLKSYKDHLLIFMGQLLQTSSNLEKSLKCKVIQQLIKLAQLKEFLNEQECTLILNYFKDILLSSATSKSKNWEKDQVTQEIVNGLIKLMSSEETSRNNKSSLVINLILPSLLEELSSTDSLSDFKKLLEIIGGLCTNYQFLEVLSIRLLNRLTNYEEFKIDHVEFFKNIINLLVESIKKIQATKQFLMNSWYKNFIPRFINCLLKFLKVKDDHIVIELSGDLIGLIVKYNDKSKHQEILDDFVGMFLLDKTKPFYNTANVLHQQNPLINLFNKILANIDKTCGLQLGEAYTVNELIDTVIKLCHSKGNEYSRLGYLQNLSLLVNKFMLNNDFIEKKLQLIFESTLNVSESNAVLLQDQIENFEIIIWILKSLILRIDTLGVEYLNKLMSLLSCENRQIQQLTAKSFNILMIDLPIFTNQQIGSKTKIISSVQNLNVRLLYKQKVFGILLPQIIEGYKTSNTLNKENYLISLSLILNNVPHSILKSYLNEILPLILNSLNLQNPIILNASLATCDIIIDESPDLIIPHLSTLIPKLVGLSIGKIVVDGSLVNNEDVRLISLKCLQKIFSNIELKYVIPFQKSTLNKLTPGLDDKKRTVRKLCCDVRQTLFELGK
ncbi:uncharacterized protein AC631_02481 [Debaryomyces fabryi]|uniref:MMS19 nucleotide excision repair protein n=1 Tax=Debaryomyces fabryi TaxID=58627 RepID=A0A0V1PZN4_9ASCO|nr:uncharacterized protein AC631_02481 [Debaryomyces fabryi]KSA01736.1 hypothetical protein AC631_02481 [Debaryomyces fabryi]CUM51278.1 unnamed protein product [Debaryomyces fabryi]